jgi:hypothetical protein
MVKIWQVSGMNWEGVACEISRRIREYESASGMKFVGPAASVRSDILGAGQSVTVMVSFTGTPVNPGLGQERVPANLSRRYL